MRESAGQLAAYCTTDQAIWLTKAKVPGKAGQLAVEIEQLKARIRGLEEEERERHTTVETQDPAQPAIFTRDAATDPPPAPPAILKRTYAMVATQASAPPSPPEHPDPGRTVPLQPLTLRRQPRHATLTKRLSPGAQRHHTASAQSQRHGTREGQALRETAGGQTTPKGTVPLVRTVVLHGAATKYKPCPMGR